MTKVQSGYVVQISPEARADLRDLKLFHRKAMLEAIAELAYAAEVETQHRKPLTKPLEELPGATWEVVVGDHRGFYEIELPMEEQGEKTARVLRVILKGRSTTQEAVRRARKR